jgi:hypothetical protein
MSYSMNHVVFEGNIGGDIKADFPEDDVAIAKFTIAQYVGAKHKETQKTVPAGGTAVYAVKPMLMATRLLKKQSRR